MTYLLLFWEFFRTGILAVGGGLATLPFLFDMGQRHPDWFTLSELTNIIAVSESTPGPIGINMATYVGCNTAGILGGLLATLGLIAPSIIIILLISRIMEAFKQSKLVKDIFHILRAAVMGLLLYSLWKVASLTVVSDGQVLWIPLGLCLVFTGLIIIFKKVHPIVFIALGALAGILLL